MALQVDGHVAASFTGGTSNSVTLTTTMTNDIIVVLAFVEANHVALRTVSSVSGGGLTWQKRGGHNDGSSVDFEYWWALSPSAQGGGMAITVTLTGVPDDWTLVAFGVNGCNTASPWDTNVSLPVFAQGTVSSLAATISTTRANDMILAFYGDVSNSVDYQNVPTGFTFVDGSHTNAGALDSSAGVGEKVVSAAQSSAGIMWGSTSASSGTPWMIVDALTADGGVAPQTASAAGTVFYF